MIFLFWGSGATLSLHFSVCAFSSCRQLGLCSFVVHGLLIRVASPVVEHRL